MDLIVSLQNDILEQNIELSSILRKAKVLASALNNREIKTWVDHELNGYQNEEELPEYRKFSAFNRGDFQSPNSILRNYPISIINIPNETFRNALQENNIPFGVKTLETTLKRGEKEFKRKWSAELIEYYNRCFGSTCIDAWKAIPIGQYDQILDSIRNRLLDFLLELQEKYPQLKEPSNDTPKIPEREVTQIFNNNIYGGHLSINSFDNCQVVQQYVQENNLTSLLDYLKKNGVPLTELDDLEISIQKDKKDGKSKDFGVNVKNWISNFSGKVFDKTLDVSLDLIKMAIFAYYGIKLS